MVVRTRIPRPIKGDGLITHAQLVETFGEDEVLLAPVDVVESHVTDPGARRVLTEVGLPDSLFETLVFEDLSEDPPRTLAGTFLGDRRPVAGAIP